MRHPLYEVALAHRSDYEQKLARQLEAYKPNWWQICIHPQTMLDYLNAESDSRRAGCMATMMGDALSVLVIGRDALRDI